MPDAQSDEEGTVKDKKFKILERRYEEEKMHQKTEQDQWEDFQIQRVI